MLLSATAKLLVLLSLSAHQTLAQSRSWKCMENKFCVQTDTNHKKTASFDPNHDTQELCRLTCGDFRGLWPQPTGQIKLSSTYVPINVQTINFNLDLVPEKTQPLMRAMVDVIRGKFSRSQDPDLHISSLSNDIDDDYVRFSLFHLNVSLSVASESDELGLDSDEGYWLRITNSNGQVQVRIDANSVFGVRHGLETLFQLTAKNPDGHRVILSNASIEDRPIYKYRGLLLDSARNFIPLKVIRETIDAMAASKLNSLHWHITDAQSFPLEIPSVPYLTQYGAYSPEKVYKITDVRDIVQYAKERGVRVHMEIDAPAHASMGWEWGREMGFGDLAVCINRQPWRDFCIQPPCGQLNPVNPNVTAFVREVYQYLAKTGMTGPFHMGGDEVHLGCWNKTTEIMRAMEKRGLRRTKEDFLQLWADFQASLLAVWDDITGSREKVIYWSSELTDPKHIESYLPADRYIIETWVPKDNPLAKELLQKGYQLIISTKDAWYLDHGFWGTTKYYSWRTVYQNKILAEANVLGGEACMWSEFVDPSSLHSRIWPRVAAFAERLWSDPITTDFNLVEPRLYQQRKRLIDLGIPADAMKPEWCLINEGECLNYNHP